MNSISSYARDAVTNGTREIHINRLQYAQILSVNHLIGTANERKRNGLPLEKKGRGRSEIKQLWSNVNVRNHESTKAENFNDIGLFGWDLRCQSTKKLCKQPRQLLKWVGNKQKFAPLIVDAMPREMNKYIEPFVGTAAVLGCLRPKRAIAGDTLKPLIDLWELVKNDPEIPIEYYDRKYHEYTKNPEVYEQTKQDYNSNPNPLDLLFISRTCYGGVMRFTRSGTISTPIGPHKPISGISFAKRVHEWSNIIQGTTFYYQSFEKTMIEAEEGDIVYCDPPYLYSQSILYGAQEFNINNLWKCIEKCKNVGAKVLLSIDGEKKIRHG